MILRNASIPSHQIQVVEHDMVRERQHERLFFEMSDVEHRLVQLWRKRGRRLGVIKERGFRLSCSDLVGARDLAVLPWWRSGHRAVVERRALRGVGIVVQVRDDRLHFHAVGGVPLRVEAGGLLCGVLPVAVDYELVLVHPRWKAGDGAEVRAGFAQRNPRLPVIPRPSHVHGLSAAAPRKHGGQQRSVGIRRSSAAAGRARSRFVLDGERRNGGDFFV